LPPALKRDAWIALEHNTYAKADHLITASAAARSGMVGRWPELEPRISVVHASAPMLIDPDRLARARPGTHGDGPLRLVTVGRLDWAKGQDLLLEALARIERRGISITIDIAGSGAETSALQAAARRLGIANRIRWCGNVADVSALLASGDVFITATRTEMFGIAVLEAMAVGLPVIAPAVGSLPEVIAAGETGILVPAAPESELPDRLADAVEALARDPVRAAALGAAGAHRAREMFSPKAMAEGVTEIYRRLGLPPTP
jgi:glycosyltransferase involved in cell wall biosynthesis